MNSTYISPVSNNTIQEEQPNTASGASSINAEPQTIRRSPLFYPGFMIALALSSQLTAVHDPWVSKQRQQTQPTVHVFDLKRHRRMSLKEAWHLADKIMADIEAARIQATEDEAKYAFDLGDFS